jgi:hypothetical protein
MSLTVALGETGRSVPRKEDGDDSMMPTKGRRLTRGEILRIVNNYIGVSGGYLNGFSYRGLSEFYPVYCDLDIDPFQFEGNTTRERFVSVLEATDSATQARIIRGLLAMLPAPTASSSSAMTSMQLQTLVADLDGDPIPSPQLSNPRGVVQRALLDAQVLIERRDAVSAVDRIHTALHGYLQDVCRGAGIPSESDASASRLLKLARDRHPSLTQAGEASKVLVVMGAAVDAVNTLRNNASVAHPNDRLIGEAEAMLVVNACRTILAYLDAILESPSSDL